MPWRGGRFLEADQRDRLALAQVSAPAAALAAGVTPEADSPLEEHLVRAVLDGLCPPAFAESTTGFAGNLLKAFDPRFFLAMTEGGVASRTTRSRFADHASNRQRSLAWQRLRERDARFGKAQAASRFTKGQKGTTSPWGNAARALAAIVGPCWLAAEIAIIGASTSRNEWTTGGDLTVGSEPFGPDPDYGRLLQVLRVSEADTAWWKDQYGTYTDPLSRGVWALALVCVADASVVQDCLGELDAVVAALPPTMVTALTWSSSRFGKAYLGRRLPTEILTESAPLSARTHLLLAHHENLLPGDPPRGEWVVRPVGAPRKPPLEPLTLDRLREMAALDRGAVTWPVHRALRVRTAWEPTSEHLEALRAAGPADLEFDDAADLLREAEYAVEDVDLPDIYLKSILQEPACYPRRWVKSVPLRWSQQHPASYLAPIAEEEGWFASDAD